MSAFAPNIWLLRAEIKRWLWPLGARFAGAGQPSPIFHSDSAQRRRFAVTLFHMVWLIAVCGTKVSAAELGSQAGVEVSSARTNVGAQAQLGPEEETHQACLEAAQGHIAQIACIKREKLRLDTGLKQIYRSALLTLGKDRASVLVNAQRAWLALREADAAVDAELLDSLGAIRCG